MSKLNDYLNDGAVRFFGDTDKGEILAVLSEAVCEGNRLEPDRVHTAILDREKLLSTGIGLGIALPHIRIEEAETFSISVGICEGGMEYGSLDDKPVKIVFLIVGPKEPHAAFVKFIADITSVLKQEAFRKALVAQTTEGGVRGLLSEY